MTDAIQIGDVVDVLRMADAGQFVDGFDLTALSSAVFHGWLDDAGGVTDAGRNILTKFGPLYPEED